MKLFHTTTYKLYQPQMKHDFHAVILSDLHFSYTVKDQKLQAILKELKKIQPTYIFIAGDLIDSTDMIQDKNERQRCIHWMKEVGKIGTTLVSLGSHDYYKKTKTIDSKGKEKSHWTYYMDQDFFNQLNHLSNVHVLDNQVYEDDQISVLGLTQSFDYYHPKTEEKKGYHPIPEDKQVMIHDLKNLNKNLLCNLDPNKVKIAMVHSPVYLKNPIIAKLLSNYNYFLSGHMHNGCVPPVLYELWRSTRGLIAPNKEFFPTDERNTLKKKDDKIIVNGPLTVFQECTGFMQKFNLLFPTYMSVIEFTNDPTYDQEKIYIKKRYHKKTSQ